MRYVITVACSEWSTYAGFQKILGVFNRLATILINGKHCDALGHAKLTLPIVVSACLTDCDTSHVLTWMRHTDKFEKSHDSRLEPMPHGRSGEAA